MRRVVGLSRGSVPAAIVRLLLRTGTGGREAGSGQVQVQSERNYLLCELGIRQALAPDSQRHQGLHERSTTLDGIFPERPWKGSLSPPVS